MSLAIICDACRAVISEREDRIGYRPAKLPGRGLAIMFDHELAQDRDRHFCYWTCLADYAVMQREASEVATR